MDRFICIHGHFYQPPRENPWLEEIELQESAYPYHDWNERITAECYAPNTASRIMSPNKMIIEIINNYSRISFNFGPTLLRWMESHAKDVYDAIIEADKKSITIFSGHGSAIAQIYNHIIMPLTNRRDKYTQTLWGIKDFERRFGRYPEGMWLPETAVDMETLEVLSELGIKFTILAPSQAAKIRKISGTKWSDVSGGKINTKNAYLCCLPSGKTINIFFFDGPISGAVSFENILQSGEAFSNRLVGAFTNDGPQLVNIATDGETYGHHKRFADMTLSYSLYHIESKNLARITNYGEFLEKFPPQYEVQIIENTSWSCPHGVERWKRNCGCNNGRGADWDQSWRQPLRDAMDWLRDKLVSLFESEASKYLNDPWKARDDYINVILDRSGQNVEEFIKQHANKELSYEEKKIVLKLLEMQKQTMFMYTSCGWFFDEISGIETVQVMQYAARAMQLAKDVAGADFETEYIEILRHAKSNIPELENGAKIFERFVKPAVVDLIKVGAHYAISSVFDSKQKLQKVYSYNVNSDIYKTFRSGKLRLVIGRSTISSEITWDEKVINFAVIWLGDHNVFCGVNEHDENEFDNMFKEMKENFDRAEIQKIIKSIDKYFRNIYSIKDLFKDEQRSVIDNLMKVYVKGSKSLYRRIFEDHYPAIQFMQDIKIRRPRALEVAVEVIITYDINKLLLSENTNLDSLENLVDNTKKYLLEFDEDLISFEASKKIASEVDNLYNDHENLEKLENVERLVRILRKLPMELNLWRSQTIIFSIGKQFYNTMKERSNKGDEKATRWLTIFNKLSEELHVKGSYI